jgi:hypothetical protein
MFSYHNFIWFNQFYAELHALPVFYQLTQAIWFFRQANRNEESIGLRAFSLTIAFSPSLHLHFLS